MMPSQPPIRLRRGASYWAVLVFLLGFVALLVVVSVYYLIPAMEAARHAVPVDRKCLAASSALLLAVVLFILLVGLLLTFRIGRFFFPRYSEQRTHTPHVDAWAESARRLQIPPPDSPA